MEEGWQERSPGPGQRVREGPEPEASKTWAETQTVQVRPGPTGTPDIRPLAASLSHSLAASEVRHWTGRGSQGRTSVTSQGGKGSNAGTDRLKSEWASERVVPRKP